MTEPSWAVVVPVRGAGGKTRLEHPLRDRLADAIAVDTVRAAAATPDVELVLVVTPRRDLIPTGPRVRVVRDPGRGLDAAVRTGLAALGRPGLHRAVLLGDLPALRGEDLHAALTRAALLPRATVPDADGTGTVLVTARAGVGHRPAFGPGSAALHRRAGYRPLPMSRTSSLRRDVDTIEDLTHALRLGVGRATGGVLSGINGS